MCYLYQVLSVITVSYSDQVLSAVTVCYSYLALSVISVYYFLQVVSVISVWYSVRPIYTKWLILWLCVITYLYFVDRDISVCYSYQVHG